jgi:hypothetical protein
MTADFLGRGVAGAIATGLLIAVGTFVKRRTLTSPDGSVVPADVAALADAAGYSPAVYALARVGASEAGGQKKIAKVAVMYVVMNEADRRGSDVVSVILGSASGFGPQGTGGRGFVSSSHDPQTIDLLTAQGVVDGSIDDPTGGAVNFDSPRAYADPARADVFEANRTKEGKELVVLEGVPASTFRFWRPA